MEKRNGKKTTKRSNRIMRKITEKAVEAFEKGVPIKISNTEVTLEDGCVCMYLHDNLIAIRDVNGEFFINNAGWRTPTTKERLNGFKGVHVIQRKGQWYLNGKPWAGQTIKIENYE